MCEVGTVIECEHVRYKIPGNKFKYVVPYDPTKDNAERENFWSVKDNVLDKLGNGYLMW